MNDHEVSWRGWVLRGGVFVILGVFVSGCGFWRSYEDPDFHAGRAERVCHPLGQCMKGSWVASDGTDRDPEPTHDRCVQTADQGRRNDWWNQSVSRGMEIGTCMEKEGFRLQQF